MRSGYPQPRSHGNGNQYEDEKEEEDGQAFAEEGRQEAVARQALDEEVWRPQVEARLKALNG
jgi:hypothetical protein